jgi:hypothetical protein
MAKAKKNKVHQQVPLINRIRREQIITDMLVSEAVQKQSEDRSQRVIWMCCIAMHRAFGIGTKRFYEKFAPEFDKVSKWWEHNAEADLAYADTKLSQMARELAPDEDILIGQAYDIFEKREGASDE